MKDNEVFPMRVAISGTHCCGKSTLIDSFLSSHGEYGHEPEPYEMLQDVLGEGFGAEASAEDLFRQLEYHVGRLHQYGAGDRVIFERSPADFLAYLLALDDMGRDTADAALARQSIAVAGSAVALLDLIVYIPAAGVDVPESEDPELRSAVDARLEGILLYDDFGLFIGDRPSILEIVGTTAQRLRRLEAALRIGE
jgi:AAA domain